jgi:hypothetical protein
MQEDGRPQHRHRLRICSIIDLHRTKGSHLYAPDGNLLVRIFLVSPTASMDAVLPDRLSYSPVSSGSTADY